MVTQAPLNALRAFEAAARTGSFANAARELGVSSAAVSQQVKLLEGVWQETLFIRQGNRISLTEAGQAAYPSLARAMSELRTLSARMQRTRPRKRRLTLSAPQSVAETWLAPRLAQLRDRGDAVPLDIRVEDDPVDLVRDKLDMRIFYGHDLYAEYQVETLFVDSLTAVTNPEMAARLGDALDGVGDDALIHTDWGRGFASSPDWAAVLPERRSVDRSLGHRVQSSSTALNLARHGMGVALLPSRMAVDDLAAGRVVELALPHVEQTLEYRLAFSKRLRANPTVQMIIAALRDDPT